MLSSFFPQDTVEDSQEVMGNLIQKMDLPSVEKKEGEEPNLTPIWGGLAVALLAVGATVSGIV